MSRSAAGAVVDGELDEMGYAVVPGAAVHLLGVARELWDELRPPPAAAFTSSARDWPPVTRCRLDGAVRSWLGPVIGEIAGPRRLFLGGFVDKGPGAPVLPLHLDLTYTDERSVRSYTCWVPLDDVDEHGRLRLVPASHRWIRGIRPAGPGGVHLAPDVRTALAPAVIELAVPAGTAVIWDGALIHGSAPNRSARSRPALAATFTAPDAALAYFHADTPEELQGFRFPTDFLADEAAFRAPPVGAERLDPWERTARPLRLDDARRLAGGGVDA